MRQIEPGGPAAANALRRLLDLKDEAHYGLFDVGGGDLRAALRLAKNADRLREHDPRSIARRG